MRYDTMMNNKKKKPEIYVNSIGSLSEKHQQRQLVSRSSMKANEKQLPGLNSPIVCGGAYSFSAARSEQQSQSFCAHKTSSAEAEQ